MQERKSLLAMKQLLDHAVEVLVSGLLLCKSKSVIKYFFYV